MIAVLSRRAYMLDCTLGFIDAGDVIVASIELPWRDNKPDESCVPVGTYVLSWYESPTHGWVLRLHDVPGRTDIELHPANLPRELKGCIAPGHTFTMFGDRMGITSSVRAMEQLRELRERGEPKQLRIRNYVGGVL